MNRALVYLLCALGKRRLLQFWRSLRRPTRLLGVAAVLALIGVLFYFRQEPVFGQLLKREALIGYALLMIGASLFKGFCDRGLVFEPPDLEFVFTSPFSQQQVLFYRLLPDYGYALVQAVFVSALFAAHLRHPLLFALGLALFQIMCFHLATAAAVYSGAIPEERYYRVRGLLVAGFVLIAAVYLRVECDTRIVPAWAASPLAQMAFYPAVNLADVTTAPPLTRWAASLAGSRWIPFAQWWRPLVYVGLTLAGAAASLALLLRLKANLFEASLATTTRRAERRLRVRQGRDLVAVGRTEARSVPLPRLACFQGVGVIVWKNLVVARRSRRKLVWAVVFTAVYTWLLAALIHEIYAKQALPDAGRLTTQATRGFNLGVVGFIGMLSFFFQRMFPFDFRQDMQHLAGFRTLPVSPLALVCAEITVPVGFVLACQAVGLIPLFIYGRLEWPVFLLVLLGYPAVALALNSVWNLYHVLRATNSARARERSPSAVGTLLVVVSSFLVFLPASWTANALQTKLGLSRGSDGTLVDNLDVLGRAFQTRLPLAAGGGLVVQYLVDLLLILLLARLFYRFEVARDA